MRNRWTCGLVAVISVLAIASVVGAVPIIDFGIPASQPASASISYAGGATPLLGSGITIDKIQGLGTSANSGAILTCVSCVLTFTTGNFTGSTTTAWNFGGGGTITVMGGTSGLLNLARTTLLTGAWTGASVTGFGSTFNITGGAFVDTKDAALLAFYGISTSQALFGGLNMGFFTPVAVTPPRAFTSSTVTSGDLVNQVSEPPILAFVGMALVGLGVWSRRRQV